MTFKKILSPVALVCAAVMTLASCGNSSSVSNKIKEYIPDDCMMVMVKGKIHEKDINRLLLEDIVKKTYTHKK